MKNEFSKKVSSAKQRLNRYKRTITKTVDFYDRETKIKIGEYEVKSKLESNVSKMYRRNLQNAYNTYKDKLSRYNKGEIGADQVELATVKLNDILDDITTKYSKGHRQEVTASYFDDDAVDYLERVTGIHKDERQQALNEYNSENNFDYDEYDVYQVVADILNKANAKRKQHSDYSSKDIYEMLYSNAIESSKYEDIVEQLAEDKFNFRNSIITDLKDDGVLTAEDEILINKLLGV